MKQTRTDIFFALGTVNSVSVPADAGTEAIRCARERVRELSDRLSVFRKDSEISRVNAGGRDFVEVHPDTLA
jgi:thiamine biosynthesis lipoprotein ApbE